MSTWTEKEALDLALVYSKACLLLGAESIAITEYFMSGAEGFRFTDVQANVAFCLMEQMVGQYFEYQTWMHRRLRKSKGVVDAEFEK